MLRVNETTTLLYLRASPARVYTCRQACVQGGVVVVVGMQDKRWSMTCRDTLFMSVSADCSNGQRRDEQQRGGKECKPHLIIG